MSSSAGDMAQLSDLEWPKMPVDLPGVDRSGDPSPRPGMKARDISLVVSQYVRLLCCFTVISLLFSNVLHMYLWQVSANLEMDSGLIVNKEVSGNDGLSSVNASLFTTSSLDSEFCPTSSSPQVSASSDNKRSASLVSSTADHEGNASSSLPVGLLPTSFISAVPKTGDSSGPFKLVIAANSLRPVVPKTSVPVTPPITRPSQPTSVLLGPAVVTSTSCTASPRKTVTVLPAGMRSPSQGPLAVVSARPVTPAAGQTTRSPGKVTVLSLPKTSSVPAQFVTVVPSTGSSTTASISAVNSKTTAMPYKVLIRPSPATVSI